MVALSVLSFMVSAILVFLLMRQARRHALHYSIDMPQRFHHGHTPRVGGVGIFLGMSTGWLVAALSAQRFNLGHPLTMSASLAVLACLLPAILGGVAEDLTQRVRVGYRLFLTIGSAVLLCGLLGVSVTRLGIGWLDAQLLAFPVVGVMFAAFAIGGLPHAFNIIDGYNGLAGTVAILTCLAIAHVALQLGDRQLAVVVLCLAGASAGFLVWNYPKGKIFAGDCGAYVWGMVIGWVCVALVQRHTLVSPWFPVMLLVYPLCETFFSIYRKMARGQSPGHADALHFHQLVFRRIVRPALFEDEARELLVRNSKTAPYLWMFSAASMVPAVLFWSQTMVLVAFIVLFALAYVGAYLAIVRFKVPGWLRF
ncbi:glycosyl transferase [Diaphorobacter nitroreducens]|uniref:glycosyltransferase family 4 protein n=1 Tax=Diaphorobacter TaxID=238749 RepID=UPI000B59EFE5|nr:MULTISPECIES: glycosyltransferase [Diaphorobacter]ASI69194.1 glycosyl transferase [Diaphorobacter nitroreducens]